MYRVPLFSRLKQVDVALLEVGLGGKFDATNVVSDATFQ
jgi:folylpolyglutamate synthase/dihydropteroate synthase